MAQCDTTGMRAAIRSVHFQNTNFTWNFKNEMAILPQRQEIAFWMLDADIGEDESQTIGMRISMDGEILIATRYGEIEIDGDTYGFSASQNRKSETQLIPNYDESLLYAMGRNDNSKNTIFKIDTETMKVLFLYTLRESKFISIRPMQDQLLL